MRLSRMSFRLFDIDTEIQKYRSYARLIESFLQTKKSELIQVAEQLPERERSEFWDFYTEAWKTIKGYNVIRNCIAHTLGDVTDMNNATKLRSVISEMENIEINDSKISLGEKFCFKALNNIQDFLHDLEESYMKRKSLQS